MPNYKKLGKDTLLMAIGNFGSRLISFLFIPFYTAVLSTEEYGTSDLISTTIKLLIPFFTLVIAESMMRFALDKENDPRAVWIIGCRVWVIGTLVFLVVSPVIRLTVLKNYYWFVVAYYEAASFNQILSYYIRGLNKVKIFAISGIFHTLFIVLLNLLFLLWLKIGIIGYLLSLIIASALSSLFMIILAKVYKFRFNIISTDSSLKKSMLKYSVPMVPNSISWWIANASDRYMLAYLAGVAATGIYSVAYKIPTIITVLSSIFMNAWRLSAVEEFGTDKSKHFFEDVFSKLTVLLVLAASFLMIINKPLAALLFSKDFYQAWQYVPLLLMASVIHTYCDFFGTIFTSAYKTKHLVTSTALGAVSNIILNLILIPIYGVAGAAIATLIGYLLTWISRLISSRKIMKLEFHWVRDIICYILITVQIFIASNSFKYEYVYSIVLFLIILALMSKEIIEVCTVIFNQIKRNIKCTR